MKVFIQSNKFQNTAAQVSKYSFEKFGYKCEIISFEDFPILKDCIGKTYLRKGKQKVFEVSKGKCEAMFDSSHFF